MQPNWSIYNNENETSPIDWPNKTMGLFKTKAYMQKVSWLGEGENIIPNSPLSFEKITPMNKLSLDKL